MQINLFKNISKYLYLFIFFLYCFQTEILVQDTNSYIENIYKRPFLYPFLINIFELLSEKNFLKYLSIFQLFLGYLAIIYFSFFFIKKYQINNFLLQIILIFSIAFPYLGISMKLGLTIFSESIGYPLILIFSIFFIKYYIYPKEKKKNKYFISMILLFIIMVLNKKTFLIILPVILLAQIIDFLFFKNFKKFLINLLIIILSFFCVNLIEKTNTYFKLGVFKTISVSGSSLLTGPFYLATDTDLKNIKGEENKKIIKFAISEFEKNNFQRNMILASENDILSFAKNNRKIFSHYFNQFVWMQDLFENKIAKAEFFGLDQKDKLLTKELSSKHCTDIAIQLFKMKPKENLIFYLTNVVYGMGGYFVSRDDLRGFYANIGFSGYYILILQILIALICIISITNNKENKKFLMIILFFIILNFCNVLATAFFQPTYDRFTFFTFQMIFFINSLVFIKFFKNNKI